MVFSQLMGGFDPFLYGQRGLLTMAGAEKSLTAPRQMLATLAVLIMIRIKPEFALGRL
jgi:hypothetical protein